MRIPHHSFYRAAAFLAMQSAVLIRYLIAVVFISETEKFAVINSVKCLCRIEQSTKHRAAITYLIVSGLFQDHSTR